MPHRYEWHLVEMKTQFLALYECYARQRRVDPEYRSNHFRPAGSDKPGNSKNLSGVGIKVELAPAFRGI